MTKYTQGPWSIHHSTTANKPFHVSGDGQSWTAFNQSIAAGDILIADVIAYFDKSDNFVGGYLRTESEDEARANASLIAAAPELLEALESALSNLLSLGATGDWPQIKMYRAAINKAKP